MAKVIAVKSKNGSRWAGYYDHRRIKVGEIFNMKEVNEDGFYLDPEDKAGKKLKMRTVKDKDGKEKDVPIKCDWVAKVGSVKPKRVDPKAVTAAISGKNPGAAPSQSDSEE